jgi:hypothetical protein
MAQLTSRASTRPHLHGDINDLETITRENWSNPSVLFEVFVELGYRRQRKRKRELKDKTYKRLIEIAGEYFDWPTTNAPGGNRRLSGALWPEEGLLSYLGYHVGERGLPTAERRAILDSVYLQAVPTVNNPVYMADWGSPRSSLRLQKIAESLAAFCRNKKRSDRSYSSVAVADWESDLAYLKQKYYDGVYKFPWPRPDLTRRWS